MRLPTLALALLLVASTAHVLSAAAESPLDEKLEGLMREASIPGMAVAVLVDGEVVVQRALGWADIEAKRPMTTSTVLNIGSVSKLVTSTAVLQLWEQGKIDLDADVSRYLPFEVRHPVGDAPLTTRQLLTHTAGLQDTDSYGASYACGDPEVSLEIWLRGYLLPGGAYHDSSNFLDQPPGTAFEYSNVGYGLLGLIAEHVGGVDFSELTRRLIFEPLGLTSTGWSLASIDLERHATPYWFVREGAEPDPEEQALLSEGPHEEGALVPFCLYSFYNYPDGLVRTTIEDLSAFILATLPGDSVEKPLLSAAARKEVFKNQLAEVETDGRVQGLGWRRNDISGLGTLWGHGGADPGIRAHVLHRPEDGVTVLAMTNMLVVSEFRPILELLFAEGVKRSRPASDP